MKLWETSFGYGNEIKGLERKYEELGNTKQSTRSSNLVYNEVVKLVQ